MYSEVLDDPKVQRLPAPLFKAWVNVMCLASMHEGVLPSKEDIAFRLRLSAEKTLTLMETLMAAGLIDADEEGQLSMHNWNGRQFKSDVSTDRVRLFRQRSRNSDGNNDETFHPTKEEKKESTKERKEENRTETDPDSDSETDTEQRQKGSGSGLNTAGTRPPDPAYELFAVKHQESTGTGYVSKTGDFVQLAKLRKANHIAGKGIPELWEQANDNYFGSPMAAYSLADLCIRFPIFRNSPLNEFKTPIHHRGNGHGPRESSQERAVRENKETAERLHRLFGDTTGDGAGPEDPHRTDIALRGGPK